MSCKEKDAVTSIAAAVRGHLTRKQYGVKQAKESELVSYTPFLIGNDMPLTKEELKAFQFDKKFVLVGTSMFRCIDFACKLTKDESIIPKVIVIDNSREVFKAWQALRRFFTETKYTDRVKLLNGTDGLMEFLTDNLHPTFRGAKVFNYFKKFFDEYPVSQVKLIVMATAVIRQDWSDISTFEKIKNIYWDMPIVAYPSNIVSYVNQDSQAAVLRCIDALKPELCLYSDLSPTLKQPTKTFVLPNPTPLVIAQSLKLADDVVQEVTPVDEKGQRL